jgi:hypothetical protein
MVYEILGFGYEVRVFFPLFPPSTIHSLYRQWSGAFKKKKQGKCQKGRKKVDEKKRLGEKTVRGAGWGGRK